VLPVPLCVPLPLPLPLRLPLRASASLRLPDLLPDMLSLRLPLLLRLSYLLDSASQPRPIMPAANKLAKTRLFFIQGSFSAAFSGAE
jgi:hypothetical protein